MEYKVGDTLGWLEYHLYIVTKVHKSGTITMKYLNPDQTYTFKNFNPKVHAYMINFGPVSKLECALNGWRHCADS